MHLIHRRFKDKDHRYWMTQWRPVVQTLVCYRLIDPSNACRLPWFEQSAMADVLGVDYALVEKNAPLPLSRQTAGA
jgi:hypothetical protein